MTGNYINCMSLFCLQVYTLICSSLMSTNVVHLIDLYLKLVRIGYQIVTYDILILINNIRQYTEQDIEQCFRDTVPLN